LSNICRAVDFTQHAFSKIKPSSVEDYSLVLHRLVFNCLRYYGGSWTSSFQYPAIDDTQQSAIDALRKAVDDKLAAETICRVQEEYEAVQAEYLPTLDDLFHKLCFKLFAHAKHDYEASIQADKFFSPVISFIILHCVDAKGGVKRSGDITSITAAIMYCIRTCITFKVLETAKEKRIDKQA